MTKASWDRILKRRQSKMNKQQNMGQIHIRVEVIPNNTAMVQFNSGGVVGGVVGLTRDGLENLARMCEKAAGDIFRNELAGKVLSNGDMETPPEKGTTDEVTP